MLGFAYILNEDTLTPLEKLLAPFGTRLWFSLAILIASAIIIILLTKRLKSVRRHFVIGGHINRTPILNMINSLLGGSIANPRMEGSQKYFGTFARTLAMLWFIWSLILRGSYQGALYNFLQHQVFSSPYDTIYKILHSDCKIIIMKSAIFSLDEYKIDRNRYT